MSAAHIRKQTNPARSLRCGQAWNRRAASFLVVWGILAVTACSPVSAQSGSVTEDRPLRTRDGWPIQITYFKSPAGRESPVVVLLHMEGGNRQVWKTFGQKLQSEGFAAISVDLRKHGESQPSGGGAPASKRRPGLNAADYQNMVSQDLEAVKRFIFDEHQNENLNMRKMAIIAAEMSAPVAINYAILDWNKKPHDDAPTPAARTPRGQDVRALVLLSPQDRVPGVNTGRAMPVLRNPQFGISFLIGVGSKDGLDKGEAKKLHSQLTTVEGNDKRMHFVEYPYNFRGTDMLGKNIRTEDHVLFFLNEHLKKLPDPWVNRRSRLSS
jgi:pimeloyl-ACP methyl ester carboxylesterase